MDWENALDKPVEFECPKNGYINGMISEHDNGAEDRRWKFYCCNIPGDFINLLFKLTNSI